MMNLGAYALGVVKGIDNGIIRPMSEDYFQHNIKGNKTILKEGKKIFSDNFSERANKKWSGGLSAVDLENACADVPEVLEVVGELKERGVGLPRVFADCTHVYLGILSGLEDNLKKPYMAKVLGDEAKDEIRRQVDNRGIDPRQIYAVCFAIWDTKLNLNNE